MDSTRFVASLFQSCSAVHSTLYEASRFSKLAVCAVMLSLSGSLSLSYSHSRSCICGGRLNCEHFLSCSSLGHDLIPTVRLLVQAADWRELTMVLLTRFYVFVQAIRGGELSNEESELFDTLFASPSVDVTLVSDFFA
jgi:hypothetical protein